ncbi:nucleoside phosphorylase [Sphingomonas sp. PAMC 26605]|uniref:nucleoside phosphorylase n=1 Tax=Sphingomonas sp. PAMC 26605 TaxID=1112214 RepID=UPI0009DA1E04|nr:nucleoside phosphorylase [Sphingomonas sp. PAMC 26605]
MSTTPIIAFPEKETRRAGAREAEGHPVVLLLARSDFGAPSVFRPENMLREARRQKGLAPTSAPATCILDPDGDIVRYVRTSLNARRSAGWACYHTEMWEWEQDGQQFGIVGSAVGASFSVLVAEQLFACGCSLLISVSSAGQIAERGPPPYHVLIDAALRDEGTSYHYLPASPLAVSEPALLDTAKKAIAVAGLKVFAGMSWTTDAPFRETAASIASRRQEGAIVVEMEAAALYAFAAARGCRVLCLAHVTNQLGCVTGDFEKGEHNGAAESLAIIRVIVKALSKTG